MIYEPIVEGELAWLERDMNTGEIGAPPAEFTAAVEQLYDELHSAHSLPELAQILQVSQMEALKRFLVRRATALLLGSRRN
jgi:hypothetical protein